MLFFFLVFLHIRKGCHFHINSETFHLDLDPMAKAKIKSQTIPAISLVTTDFTGYFNISFMGV